jgi:hypothetical protein
MEVAQINESEPRIAGLLLQLVPVAQIRISQVSASATVPEKPTGSSREDMKRPRLDGHAHPDNPLQSRENRLESPYPVCMPVYPE